MAESIVEYKCYVRTYHMIESDTTWQHEKTFLSWPEMCEWWSKSVYDYERSVLVKIYTNRTGNPLDYELALQHYSVWTFVNDEWVVAHRTIPGDENNDDNV